MNDLIFLMLLGFRVECLPIPTPNFCNARDLSFTKFYLNGAKADIEKFKNWYSELKFGKSLIKQGIFIIFSYTLAFLPFVFTINTSKLFFPS